MSITFFSESPENMQIAIEDYGKHKRFVVAAVIIESSEGNEYVVFADFAKEPSFRTLKRLANQDNRWYYEERYESEREYYTAKEWEKFIDEKVEEEASEYIIIDTKEFIKN